MGIVEATVKKRIAIDAFFSEYREYVDTNQSEKTAKRYKTALWHFERFLMKFPQVKMLSHIDPSHIEKFKTYRKTVAWPKGFSYLDRSEDEIAEMLAKAESDGVAPASDSTVRFELQTLRTVFRLAVKWKFLKENPATQVKLLTVSDIKTPRFLNQSEITELLDNSSGEKRGDVRYELIPGLC